MAILPLWGSDHGEVLQLILLTFPLDFGLAKGKLVLTCMMAFAVLLTGILFVIVAVTVLKIHPFLALILAAFLVGLLSPVPLGLREEAEFETARLDFRLETGEITAKEHQQLRRTLRERVRERLEARPRKPGADAVQALELTTREFGTTAASIGLVIVLAAIIGQCLLESGAADKITRRLLALLGEKRAPLALLSSGYFLSIPVFFDTVFFPADPAGPCPAAAHGEELSSLCSRHLHRGRHHPLPGSSDTRSPPDGRKSLRPGADAGRGHWIRVSAGTFSSRRGAVAGYIHQSPYGHLAGIGTGCRR